MKINSGTILLAFFAILAGMVGAYLYRHANRPVPVVAQPAPPKPRAPKTMIVPMVSRNLTPGQTITKDDVALVRMTKEQLNERGMTHAFMTQPEQIIGKTAKTALRRGSTFDTRDFYPIGQRPGIAQRLKPGQRAVTISMSAINALIGFAGAGQSVDVLFHYGQNSDASQRPVQLAVGQANVHGATSTLVQGAEILALNQLTNRTTDASPVSAEQRTLVTLAVYPREAELLRVAGGHGELSLSLRNPTDVKTVPLVDPRTVDEIIQVRSNQREMEIYRGQSVSRLKFVSHGGINRRFVDGSRENQVAAAIEQASRHASQQDIQSANHSARFTRDLSLPPAIGAPAAEGVRDDALHWNQSSHSQESSPTTDDLQRYAPSLEGPSR